MQVQSYLFFDGRCEEALEFYKVALGAKVIDTAQSKIPEDRHPIPDHPIIRQASFALGRAARIESRCRDGRSHECPEANIMQSHKSPLPTHTGAA